MQEDLVVVVQPYESLFLSIKAVYKPYINGEPILVPKLANHLFLSSVYIALLGTRKGSPTLVPKLV